ncbi:MAG TPA: hypothetical protein VHD36_09280 [Pirellulales bacterium]|nr:hypothetical protein [Pirellulales bacterium]
MASVDRRSEECDYVARVDGIDRLHRLGDVLPEVLAQYGLSVSTAGQRAAGIVIAESPVYWELEVAC